MWTNAGSLLIGPLGINFVGFWIKIQQFSSKKMHLKMSSVKWCPFCLSLNVSKEAYDEGIRHPSDWNMSIWSKTNRRKKPTWAFITINTEEMTIVVYWVDLFSSKLRLTSRSKPFCRRYFQMHCRVWTLLCFDSNVTEFRNHASSKQTAGIVSDHAWNPLFEAVMAHFT